MIYQETITTTKNTQKADEKETTLYVNKGLVYRMEVFFPRGSRGDLYVKICDSGFQLWPTTPNEYFRGENIQIIFDDVYMKEDPPYEFQIYTYNVDTSNDHVVFVRVGMVIKEIFMARFLPHLAYRDAVNMLNKMYQQQEAEKVELFEHPYLWIEKE